MMSKRIRTWTLILLVCAALLVQPFDALLVRNAASVAYAASRIVSIDARGGASGMNRMLVMSGAYNNEARAPHRQQIATTNADQAAFGFGNPFARPKFTGNTGAASSGMVSLSTGGEFFPGLPPDMDKEEDVDIIVDSESVVLTMPTATPTPDTTHEGAAKIEPEVTSGSDPDVTGGPEEGDAHPGNSMSLFGAFGVEGMMGNQMLIAGDESGMVVSEDIVMVENSFLSLDEYVALRDGHPQTFAYLTSLFGAEDLTQVTADQALSVTTFDPSSAGAYDMNSTAVLTRMSGLKTINLSGQPISDFPASAFSGVTSLDLSGLGLSLSFAAGDMTSLTSLNVSGSASVDFQDGALPSLSQLNVDNVGSVTFGAGALSGSGIKSLSIGSAGSVSFGAGALGNLTTLTLTGDTDSLTLGAGALPSMTKLDTGASLSTLTMEDGACASLTNAANLVTTNLGSLYLGTGALPKMTSGNFSAHAIANITFAGGAAPICTALTLSSPALQTLTFEDGACNAVTTLTLNNTGSAALQKVSIGSNALNGLTSSALNLSKNANLNSFTLGSGSLSNLQTFTISESGLQSLGFLGEGALPAVKTFNMLNMSIEELVIPGNCLGAMTTLNMSDNHAARSITFADNSAPVMTGLSINNTENVTDFIVGDGAMNAYVSFNTSLMVSPIQRFAVGDNSLIAATTYNVGKYAEEVTIGSGSLGKCTTFVVNGVNNAGAPLRALSIGAGSLGSATALNLANNKQILDDQLSIGADSLANVKTLTLDGTGVTDLGFLTGKLSGLTTLSWKNMASESVTIPANALPGLLTLDLSNSGQLKNLNIGANAAPGGKTLTLTGCANLTNIHCDSGAMGALGILTVKSLSGSALTVSGGGFAATTRIDLTSSGALETLNIGDGAMPMLSAFTTTGCTSLVRMNIGNGAVTGATSFGIPSTIKEISVGDGAMNAVSAFAIPTIATTVSIGDNALNSAKLTVNATAASQLVTFVVGNGSLNGSTMNALNFANNANLTQLSVGEGSLSNVATLTLDSTPLDSVGFGAGAFAGLTTLYMRKMSSDVLRFDSNTPSSITALDLTGSAASQIVFGEGALPGLTALTLSGTGVETLAIGQGTLPKLITLTLGTTGAGSSKLRSFSVGDGALNSLNTLTFGTGAGAPLEKISIGSDALGAIAAMNLGNNLQLAEISVGNGSLGSLKSLTTPSGLVSLKIGDDAMNAATGLTFSTASTAPLSLTVGKNSLCAIKTLGWNSTALETFTAGEGSFAALESLSMNNTKLMNMDFLKEGAMQQLQRLYMQNVAATELTVPEGSLQKCIYLDLHINPTLESLTFEDNTCPLVPQGSFQLYECPKLSTLIVGDNCLNSYGCWNPIEGKLPVKTYIIGNGSLNKAVRFGLSNEMETVQIGNNSFQNIETLHFKVGGSSSVTATPVNLRSFVVGTNSFTGAKLQSAGATYQFDFTGYASLSHLSIGAGSFTNLATMNLTNTGNLKGIQMGDGALAHLTTLTLTNSGITELAVGDSALGDLTTLTLGDSKGSNVKALNVGANALPKLTALNFGIGGPLARLTVGDGALASLKALSLTNNKQLQAVELGVGALPVAGTIDMSNIAADLVSFGASSAPAMTSLKLNGAAIGKLSFGEGSGGALTGATALLNGVTSLKEFEAANGALKNLTNLGAVPGNQLTRFATAGDALANVQSLNLGIQAGLTALDADLTGMIALTDLQLSGTAIQALDFADGSLQKVTKLSLPAESLQSLRFGVNTLPLYAGNSGALLLNNYPQLTSLEFGAGSLPLPTSIRIDANPSLNLFEVGDGALAGVTQFTANGESGKSTLSTFRLLGKGMSKVQRIDLSDAANLSRFEVDASALTALTALDLSRTKLALETVEAGAYPALTELKLEGMDNLTGFSVGEGALDALQTLKLTDSRNLASLSVGNGSMNKLSTLDVAGTAIADATFGDDAANALVNIDWTALPLETLQIGENTLKALTSLALCAPEGSALRLLTVGDGSLGGIEALNLADAANLSVFELEPNALAGLKALDVSRSGLTEMDFSDGRYQALEVLTAEEMLSLGNGGAFSIENGELPMLKSLLLKGQRSMTTLDIKAGSAGSPTLPNLTELSVAPLDYAGGTSITSIPFHTGTMPLVREIALNNIGISGIELEEGAMVGLEKLSPSGSTKFTSFVAMDGAAPNLYRFQRDNSALTELSIGDGACLNLGLPLEGEDYDPLGGISPDVFQTLSIGAGERGGEWLRQLDLTGFTAFRALDLAEGCALPDMENIWITGTQLMSFPSLDGVSLPNLKQLHLYDNPSLTGEFVQGNLPETLVELKLSRTGIAALNLSGSTVADLRALEADNCKALTSVTINTTGGAFGSRVMDAFKFANDTSLASMKLDSATIDNLMGSGGQSFIELYNTRLGYKDLLPLVRTQNSGGAVTIRLPDDFMQALNAGEVSENPETGSRVALIYSDATYNSGSGDGHIASGVIVDNLYPVYRVQPEIYYAAGAANGLEGPMNGMAGTFEADQADGGLIAYLNTLPESQAQGVRALLAYGFPNKTLGLSANDAACATAEAISAYLNENLPADRRVAGNYNYLRADSEPVDGLHYAEAPDPDQNPEGYKLYMAVMQLLDKARFAETVAVDNTPAELSGAIDQILTDDKLNAGQATMTVRVTQKNINGKYFIADYSDNITKIERQQDGDWVAIENPLRYQGDPDDMLRLTINNRDKTAPILLTLKAVNTLGIGQYYDVTSSDGDDLQNDRYKSDYISVRGVETTDYDTPITLRAAEAVILVHHMWKGQDAAIAPIRTVTFPKLKPGDKISTDGSGDVGLSPLAIEGFVDPAADCGASFEITLDGGEITYYYKKPVTVTGDSGKLTYNGKDQVFSGYRTDLVDDELYGMTATATGRSAGAYDVEVSGTPSLASNKAFDELYRLSTAKGLLTIEPAELSVKAASGSFSYDATEHTVEGYVLESGTTLFGNDQLTVELTGNTRTLAGTGDTAIASFAIMNGEDDAAANYLVDATGTGTIIVNRAMFSINAPSGQFTYDARPHAVTGYEHDAGALYGGAILETTLSGDSRTEVGVNETAIEGFAIRIGNEDVTDNYDVTVSARGQIEIKRAPLNIKAASNSFVYNGNPQTVVGYEIAGGTLFGGDQLTVELADATRTHVGSNATRIANFAIQNGGADASGSYDVTYTGTGTVSVTAAPLTIKAGSGEYEYNATERSASGYEIIGGQLFGGDQLSVVLADNTRTDAGDSETRIAEYAIANGTETVTGDYAVNAEAKGLLRVNKKQLTVTPGTQSFVYNGTEHAVSYAVEGLLPNHAEQVVLEGAKRKLAGNNDVTVASTRVMAGNADVTDNYDITSGTGRITVTQASVTFKAGSGSFLFSGEPHTITSTDVIGAIAPGDAADVELQDNRRTEVGEQELKVSKAVIRSGNEDVTDSYKITNLPGKITVAMIETDLIITANDVVAAYDGQMHSGTAYSVAGLKDGDTVRSVTITGQGTDAGSYELVPSAVEIVDANNKPVLAYANISYVSGKLTITQRPATLTIDNLKAVYDMGDHTASFKAIGLLTGHEPSAALVGATRREVGQNPVTFDASSAPAILAGTADVTKNYSLTLIPGSISVSARGGAVKIAAKNVRAAYDGQWHGANGFDVTGLASGDHVDGVTISGEGVNAGTYNLIPAGARILDANNRNVTSGYQRIDYASGTLTIVKRMLTISAETRSFPFDGEPHKVGYTVSGDLLSGDAVTGVVLTGNARTQAGSNEVLVGKVSVENGGTNVSGNYDIIKRNGLIEVAPRSDASYRVQYYYAGVLDSAATVVRTNQMLGQVIANYPNKAKAGFTLSRVQYGADIGATALTIGQHDANNVINVYYERTGGTPYTVEYLYQNIKLDGYDLGNVDTVGGMKPGDVVTQIGQRVEAATLSGFTFERSEGLPMTIVEDASQNVIRVYYDRATNLEYRVEYYYNGVRDDAATERYNGLTYGTVIRKYQDKNRSGHQLQSVETLPFALTAQGGQNVIRVYYDLVGGGELPETIVEDTIPLGAGVGSLNAGDAME